MIPEREREALMRLTMCAREECSMCIYEDKCNFDFQYETATSCMHILADALHKTENRSEIPTGSTISKMEQVDEPQTNADQRIQSVESVETIHCQKCKHYNSFQTPIRDGYAYNYMECDAGDCIYEPKDEPQTERSACDTCQWYNSGIPCGVEPSVCKREVEDEPQ